MIDDECAAWSAFDASIRDWEEQSDAEKNQSPESPTTPPERVLGRSRQTNPKKLRKEEDRSHSSSRKNKETRRVSPKRNPSKELERRSTRKSLRRNSNDAKKQKSRTSSSNRASQSRAPYASSSSSANDPEATGISDAMRQNIIRRGRGRPSSRQQASRPRSISRTPSRQKRRTAIELSPRLACARASSRVPRRNSWRASKEESLSAHSDSESDSDTSEADARRKVMLDVSRKGPVRALIMGRKHPGEAGDRSDEDTDENDDLLLENSSHVAGSLASSNSFSENRSLTSVSKVDERLTRRTSADLSQVQMPDYYGSRYSDSETSITRSRRRASLEHAKKKENGAARDSNSTVDDILKSRRLRRASASHRRGSVGGSEIAGRRASANHRRASTGDENIGRRRSSSRASTNTTSTSERQGHRRGSAAGSEGVSCRASGSHRRGSTRDGENAGLRRWSSSRA